jgi:4-amino-4-deoxy-L-arabinose transferase-like glycosyltransferase
MSAQRSLARPHSYRRSLSAIITIFCLVWWAVFSLTRHYLDSADMVENFAWGMEWQWGTNKHPPLFGWITAAWFHFFPVGDSAYYLLNEINLALAMFLMALAMRRVMTADKVLSAVVLTLLCSKFGPDSGYKYNANTAQLPFIAGYLWALLSGLQDRRHGWFVLAGLFAGAAVLSKYYALVMLLAITLSLWFALRTPLRFLLVGMCVAGVTALPLVLPHVIWAMHHGWPTLAYMHDAHDGSLQPSGPHPWLEALTGCLMFMSLPLLVWGLAFIRLPVMTPIPETRPKPRPGLIMFSASVLLTLLASLIEGIDPVSSWFIPVLLLTGWVLMEGTPEKFDSRVQLRRITAYGIAYLVLTVIVAVFWEKHYREYPAPPPYALPETLAHDVTALYRSDFGQPVQYVAGTFPLPYVMSFYSPDHPHGLYGADLEQSPWIDPKQMAAGNRVAICNLSDWFGHADTQCRKKVVALFGRPERIVQLDYRVYLPKSKRLGWQHYEVLFWSPAALNGVAGR